jgi:hypothetical protein
MDLHEALTAALEEERVLREQRDLIDKKLADVETELRGLRMAIERHTAATRGTVVVGAELRAPGELARTDAIMMVLRKAERPLNPSEVVEALHDLGRDDEYNAVSAALAHLARTDRAYSASRGQWRAGPKSEQVGDPRDQGATGEADPDAKNEQEDEHF